MEKETKYVGKDFLEIILPWKKSILVFCGISITCSIIFSSPYFITPLYKSEVILYPPTTNSTKALLENDMRFGTDKEIDEQLQIYRSGILRDSIIRKYNLMKRYNINNSDKYSRDNLYKKYEDRIQFDRTRYNAISVTAYDANADTAALIANDIVVLGDKVKEGIFKGNFKAAYQILENQFLLIKKDLNDIQANIQSLGKFSGKLNDKTEREQILQKTKEQKNIALLTLLNEYEFKLEKCTYIEGKYNEAREKMFNIFPASYIITPATVSDKKAYPSRSTIVLLSFVCSLLFAVTVVFIIDKLKNL